MRYRRPAQIIYPARADELAALLRPQRIANPVVLNNHPSINVDALASVMAERARAALETVEEVAMRLAKGAR